jgi:Flp pilus assembly protein TadG
MERIKVDNRPFRAQALLEFALVAIILFMLIFGVIEIGRLIFVYSSVITSSREAVRFGSVAGVNEAGNLNYQDCTGIRNIVRRLAFYQNLDDDDILIEYDKGPGTAVYDQCDDSDGVIDGVDTNVNPVTGDRIRVTVTARFDMIVPIIPIDSREIISTSTRTILGIIKLE